MRDFIVLRDLGAFRTSEPFARPDFEATMAGRSPRPSEPRVDVERVELRHVAELAREPEVRALAPTMPTRLIAPVGARDGEPASTGAAAAADAPAWGVGAVKADESPFDGSGVTVAVLDTGIDASHPAFAGVTVVGRDFSGAGEGDRQGHGTHCAGTILGRDVDGTRIGIARGIDRAVVGKVLGDDGGGSSEMIFQGILWALDQGAQVVSMSLGFDFPGLVRRLVDDGWPVELATSAALEAYRANAGMFDALIELAERRAAFDGGAVVVAAAGNESDRDRDPRFEIAASLPSAAKGVVSVGALGQGAGGLAVAGFSNTFPQVSAPGVGIVSAKLGGGLVALNGTSMACPHVAGVAALWWQAIREAPVLAGAPAVLAKLVATARSGGFVAGVDPADRGMGIVTAPLAAIG